MVKLRLILAIFALSQIVAAETDLWVLENFNNALNCEGTPIDTEASGHVDCFTFPAGEQPLSFFFVNIEGSSDIVLFFAPDCGNGGSISPLQQLPPSPTCYGLLPAGQRAQSYQITTFDGMRKRSTEPTGGGTVNYASVPVYYNGMRT